MLKALVEFSIRFRGVVIALAVLVTGSGFLAAARARIDVFPEFAPAQVVVQTEAPGHSPEEVEALVTRPVEDAMNGIAGIESIRSQSIQGLSVVTATFREGTDLLRARQASGERLGEAAGRMPSGIAAPTMAPLTSATSVILEIGLTSKRRSPMDVRTFADGTLRPRLLGVPGVAKVVVSGGEVRQIQIQARSERLAALGLSLGDVLDAARRSTGIRGAGFAENANQRIVLRTEGPAPDPAEIGEAVVPRAGGAGMRLQDVARVAWGPEPKLGDASIQGEPGVVLVLSSQYGANTQEVTEAAERALDELRPAIEREGITLHPALFRPADFIETAVGNVRGSLLAGGLLVAAVLVLFLVDVRAAFVSLTAIPLSLLAAVIVLDALGATLNTLTLGGLAIAIGEVVDDAIIDVENILRRLRENRASPAPRPLHRVVLDASLEVRGAVVYATFVVALVFLPILTMSGVEGRLFRPLGVAYLLAILASLAVALTVTPALSFALLARGAGERGEPRYVGRLKARYRRLLERLSRRPRTVAAGALAAGAAAAAAIPFFGGAFLPELREGQFIVHMSAVPGTSLPESLRLGRAVTQELLRNPHVRSVCQRAGRAEMGDDTFGTHYSEFNVDLVPLAGEEEAESVQGEIREALLKFPGVHFAIKPFLTERIEETISGLTAEVVVQVFGEDLDALDRAAGEAAREIGRIDGAADVQVDAPPDAPGMAVRLRAERLRKFGIPPLDVLEAVQTAAEGAVAARAHDGSRILDVVVILDPSARRDPEALGDLLLRTPGGTLVPLRELADVYPTTGRYAILHEGARRRVAVTCDVRGRDLDSFVAEARRAIRDRVALPPGIYATFAGAAEARARAQGRILLHAAAAGAGIVLLLAIVFRTARNLLLVLANLPFALVGGVLAVFASGGWLTIGSLVGFVTLFGITMRNSMMMISHFEHLAAEEGMAWGPEAAFRGASERLLPILMTALVTGLGLLPLAAGSGAPGREIEGPMAVVILGGLASSTLLNLLVLPTLALRYGRFASP